MIQVANLVDLKTVYIGKGVPFILRAIISKHIISHEKNEYSPRGGICKNPLALRCFGYVRQPVHFEVLKPRQMKMTNIC